MVFKFTLKKETIKIKFKNIIELKAIFSGNDELSNNKYLSFKIEILNERKKHIIIN